MTAAAQREARGHELITVQCLRGLAAMMVVLYHCFPQLERMGYKGNHFQSLSAGVDIFFVISGFIMLYSAHRAPARGPGAFLLNRAIRIVPIYWMLTSFMVAIALLAPQLMVSTRFEPTHVLMSYLMLPAKHPVIGYYWPILIPGWTLNYEMFFYLIFAAGLWLLRGRDLALALFVGGIILVLVLMPLFVPVDGAVGFYTYSVMIEFVFGLGCGLLFLRGWRMPKAAGGAAIAIGFALLFWTDFFDHPDVRGLTYGMPALMIFAGAVLTRWSLGPADWRLPQMVGDASYSIYLTNMIAMSAIGMGWRKLLGGGMPGNTVLFIVFALTVCGLSGVLFYRLVEAPVTEWLKNRAHALSSRTEPVAAE